MYIIIAGAGVIGRQVTCNLVAHHHDVVVIDKNKDQCTRIYSETGALTINGDATDINILEKAGCSKADTVVTVMKQDSDNISCALLSKSLGVNHIVGRLRIPEYKDAYRLAGITSIIAVTNILVNEFMMEIEQPKVRRIVYIGKRKASLLSVTVPPNAICIGKSIREIAANKTFPKESVIAGIYRAKLDSFVAPRGNTYPEEGDSIFFVTTAVHIITVANAFTKTKKK